MSAFKDISGQRFGRLVALYRVDNSPGTPCHPRGWVRYMCKCDCGKELVTRSSGLNSGHTKSCGCLHDEHTSSLNFRDITGKTYGRLTVVEKVGKTKTQKVLWRCKCSCGGSCITTTDSLTTGNTQSCGCLQRERTGLARRKWTDEENDILEHYDRMRQRCCNPNSPAYPEYGGRGIYICQDWLNPETGRRAFVEWAKTHGYRKGLELDRRNDGEYHKDQNGPYAPWNCRWVDQLTQSINRRGVIELEINGVKMVLSEWARFLHKNYSMLLTIYHRKGREALIERIKQIANPHVVDITNKQPASVVLTQIEKKEEVQS